jgi:hypothetical protein
LGHEVLRLHERTVTMTWNKAPNPGSDEAVAAGCQCPVLDNSRGKGWMMNPDLFWISANCPLHANNNGVDEDNESEDDDENWP